MPHAHRQNASRRSTLLTFLGSLGIAYAPIARADDAVQVPDNIGNFADSINKLEVRVNAYTALSFFAFELPAARPAELALADPGLNGVWLRRLCCSM